jgi:hypothetical protein
MEGKKYCGRYARNLYHLLVRKVAHVKCEWTDVLISHTSKNSQTPILALAAALYDGLT